MNDEQLSIGNRYSRDDLEKLTGKGFPNVNPGICRRVDDEGNPYGLLFATETGQYENRISDEGRFSYMGEGKDGQDFKENYPQYGNCFLRDSISEGHPLHFFYRENKNNKYEYRGELGCKGYELLDSGEQQKISFKMEYKNYPEGLPSPTPKELRNFRTKVSDRIGEKVSEKELRNRVIDVFLYEVLGWNKDSSNESSAVEEYSVRIGSKSIRADYAFTKGNNVKCLVEVKRPSTSLSEDEKAQLSSYMKLTECSFGLLTNGNRWIVLVENEDGEPLEQTSLVDVLLDDIDNVELFVLLHHSTLSQRESEDMAVNISQKRKTVKALREHKQDYVKRILDDIPEVAQGEARDIFEESMEKLTDKIEDETPVLGRPEMHKD
jgi:predicted type IV restriction endonuclease